MKKIFFNYNQYLKDNNFSIELKKQISKLINSYLREEITIPKEFERFDQDISDLIIKISETQELQRKDLIRKNRKNFNQNKKIYKVRKIYTQKWYKKKFFK